MKSATQLEAEYILHLYDRGYDDALTCDQRQAARAQLDWLLRIMPMAACRLYYVMLRRRDTDATQSRQLEKNDQYEHSARDHSGETAEASGGDCAVESGEE
jgi:hypothetical protein